MMASSINLYMTSRHGSSRHGTVSGRETANALDSRVESKGRADGPLRIGRLSAIARHGFVAALALSGCAAAVAEETPAGAQLRQQLEATTGGKIIRLAPGDYGSFTFPQKAFQPAITIDATQARFTGIIIKNAQGIEIRGGTLTGPGGRSYGIQISKARGIRIERMAISGAHRGIVVGESHNVALVENRLTGLISDGINIGGGSGFLIERNICRDFLPTPATFDSAGVRIKDGDHPDCIQAWSRPSYAPTSDLTIIGNDIAGKMQGIFLGNHIRNGIDDGGFDRVVVKNNRLKIGAPNGIVGGNVRDGLFTDNIVESDGTTYANKPGVKVKTNMRVTGARIMICNNRVPDVPKAEANARCTGKTWAILPR